MRVRFTLVLALLGVSTAITALPTPGLDICHSEPQVEVARFQASNAPTCEGEENILIHSKFHGNPYHSLHDSAWALVHYMRNCLSPPYWSKQWKMNEVFIHVEVHSYADLSLCDSEPSDEEYDRKKRPLWGPCLVRAVALNMGIPDRNVFAGPESNSSTCFHNTVNFRERFRPLLYHASMTNKTGQKLNLHKTLPEWVKRDAFNTMAEAPFRTYLRGDKLWTSEWVAIQKPRSKVNVLVYDRMDKRPWKLKRKWYSPGPLVDRLKSVDGLVVDHRSEMPKSLTSQARIFRWADLVLAPHGAAMANTLFMQKGAQVVEINKCCKKEVRLTPESRRDWTGWHADLIRFNLRYVQCHSLNGTFSVEELADFKDQDSQTQDEWCNLPFFRVDDDEVFTTVQALLPGQFRRVARDDRESYHGMDMWKNMRECIAIVSAMMTIIAWNFVNRRGKPRRASLRMRPSS